MPECPVRAETKSKTITWDAKKIVLMPSYDIDEAV
jgi:hypothetical protein